MPSRNIVKIYDTNTYYHVYNRGVEKRQIFLEDVDYSVFLNLLKRYLSPEPVKDNKGREYDWLANDVKILAFCLMPNHYHILLYQIEERSMTVLMRNVCTAYTVYFNTKYKRVGGLFQGNFKASIIRDESYLAYISRYIHRNPVHYMSWKWSSLPYWLGDRRANWLHPELLNDLSMDEYKAFIGDDETYESSKQIVNNLIANK